MSSLYIFPLIKLIEEAANLNEKAFDTVATKLSETLANKGLVHLYGSGHSVLPVQETFPRYGSYVGFNPLTDPRVMWYNVLGAGGVRELLIRRVHDLAVAFAAGADLLSALRMTGNTFSSIAGCASALGCKRSA